LVEEIAHTDLVRVTSQLVEFELVPDGLQHALSTDLIGRFAHRPSSSGSQPKAALIRSSSYFSDYNRSRRCRGVSSGYCLFSLATAIMSPVAFIFATMARRSAPVFFRRSST
jgi:hypothetical protein